jgi:hypothetical protein
LDKTLARERCPRPAAAELHGGGCAASAEQQNAGQHLLIKAPSSMFHSSRCLNRKRQERQKIAFLWHPHSSVMLPRPARCYLHGLRPGAESSRLAQAAKPFPNCTYPPAHANDRGEVPYHFEGSVENLLI